MIASEALLKEIGNFMEENKPAGQLMICKIINCKQTKIDISDFKIEILFKPANYSYPYTLVARRGAEEIKLVDCGSQERAFEVLAKMMLTMNTGEAYPVG